MQSLDIRNVIPTDFAAWRAVAPGCAWPRALAIPANATLPAKAWTWLGAWRGERCVARLRTNHAQAELVVVNEVAVAAGENADRVAPALLAALGERLPSDLVRVYAEEVAEDAPLRRWLDAAGFQTARRKVVVRRELPFEDAPDLGDLSLHSLAEVGEEAFAQALDAAAEGDPFEEATHPDPLSELRDLIQLAGEAFDANAWWMVRQGAETVGVVLPQADPGEAGLGTLYYIGVTPAHRGRGLGRRLHALGLGALGTRGLVRYVGSSEVKNAAMLRIFDQNGCGVIARQRFYTWP